MFLAKPEPAKKEQTSTMVSERVQRLDTAAKETLMQARAENTYRAYTIWWQDFVQWCQDLEFQHCPTTPRELVRYLNHLKLKGRSLSTIRTARTAVSYVHRIMGIPDAQNPAQDLLVTETMKGMSTRAKPQTQAKAMLPEALDAIRSTAMLPRDRSNAGPAREPGQSKKQGKGGHSLVHHRPGRRD